MDKFTYLGHIQFANKDDSSKVSHLVYFMQPILRNGFGDQFVCIPGKSYSGILDESVYKSLNLVPGHKYEGSCLRMKGGCYIVFDTLHEVK